MKQTIYYRFLLTLVFLIPLLAPWTLKSSLIISPVIYKFILATVGIFIAFILWLFSQNKKQKLVLINSDFYKPISLFLLWGLITFSWALSLYDAALLWIDWFIAALAFVLVVNSIKTNNDFRKILLTILASGTVVAIIGIAQHLLDFNLIRQAVPPASTFGNKNLAGHFMTLVLPLSLGFLLAAKNYKDIIKYTISFILIASFIIFVNSRSTWLAVFIELIIGFIYFIFINKKLAIKIIDKNKIIIILLSTLVIFVMSNLTNKGFEFQGDRISKRLVSIIDDADFDKGNERINPWLNTLYMIKENNAWLYGLGFGNWTVNYPKYFNKVGRDITFSERAKLKHAHNDYIETLANVGIIGFAFIIWVLILFIKKSYRLLTVKNTEDRYLLAAIFLSCIGFSVNAFFSFPAKVFFPLFIMMILVALIVNYDFRTKDFNKDKLAKKAVNKVIKGNSYLILPQYSHIVLKIVILVILFVTTYFLYNYALSRHYYSTALIAHQNNNWHNSNEEVKKALKYDRFYEKSMFLFARNSAMLNDLNNAVKYYEKIIKTRPYYLNALLNLSAAYFNSNNNKKGVQYLQKVLKLNPENIKANLILTDWYAFKGKKELAVKHFKKVKSYVYKQKVDYANLGSTAIKLKLYNEARLAFEQAFRKNNKDYVAIMNLGIIWFYYLDNKEKGVALMQYALKFNPNDPQANLAKKAINAYLQSKKNNK